MNTMKSIPFKLKRSLRKRINENKPVEISFKVERTYTTDTFTVQCEIAVEQFLVTARNKSNRI